MTAPERLEAETSASSLSEKKLKINRLKFMKKNIFAKIILLAAAALFLNLFVTQSALAIGQMTKPIVIKDLLRGQAAESVLILYNSEPKETVYKLIADGDIKDWTSFYLPDDLKNPITEIKVPASSNVKAIARFFVPKDTPNGAYKGEVAIVSAPGKEENKGVNVSVGMRVGRQVSITVTGKEVVKFDASVIPAKYDLAKNEPLNIRVIYENQGNVSIAPEIRLKIKKDNTTVYSVVYPYPESKPPVNASARYEIPAIEVPTGSFETGRYDAELSISDSGSSVEKKFGFSVGLVEASGAPSSAALAEAAGSGNRGGFRMDWFLIAAAGAILVSMISGFFKNRKPK